MQNEHTNSHRVLLKATEGLAARSERKTQKLQRCSGEYTVALLPMTCPVTQSGFGGNRGRACPQRRASKVQGRVTESVHLSVALALRFSTDRRNLTLLSRPRNSNLLSGAIPLLRPEIPRTLLLYSSI